MIQNLIFGFFFFENISVSGMQLFYIWPRVSVDIFLIIYSRKS